MNKGLNKHASARSSKRYPTLDDPCRVAETSNTDLWDAWLPMITAKIVVPAFDVRTLRRKRKAAA
jgi:hypothetical protein